MSAERNHVDEPDTHSGEPTSNPWLSPRRLRFWSMVAVLLYTLGGFFLAPLAVEKLAVNGVRDSMGRELEVGKVRVNPYVLSVDIEDLALRDPDGETVFALDRFRANFQLSSLFRWALTFSEIAFEAPYLLYERFAPGDDRLTRLLADMERLDTEPEPPATEPAALPRLLIHDLLVNGGRADFRDHVPREPVVLAAGPVTVEIRELNTLPDREGRQAVEIHFSESAAVIWQGSLTLEPLTSDGRLTLQNIPLGAARPYLDEVVDLASFDGKLSVRTEYRIEQGPDQGIAVALSGLETELEDLSATGFEPPEPILNLEALRTRNGAVAYPEARFDAGTIAVTGLELDLQLDENGQPRILQLLKAESAENSPAEDDTAPAAPWQVNAERFAIEQARITLQDRSVAPPADLVISGLDVALTGIDNRAGTSMPLTVDVALEGGGRIGLSGDLSALPAVTFDGQARIDALPVALAQPYVQQAVAVQIEGGAASGAFDLSYSGQGDIRLDGSAGVADLQLIDTIENQPLLAWKRLAIDRLTADTGSGRAEVSRIDLEEPFGRVQVRADRSTNLAGLLVEGEAAPERAVATADEAVTAEAAEPWHVIIGLIDFENGSMDFSDLSLPLPFAVRIGELGGAVSAIDSASTEPAGVRLEGAVGDYGLARIEGELQIFDPLATTDITMEFRNVLMSELSPYSIEFAGRRIDEGKLNLDLEYVIENSLLAGKNAIVVSDLLLGAKVESPNAVSLPLDLAVALLKDSDGVIDIDLPVEGDVGDPEFRIGGVIWKAFTGLITKIVTAPFALLGNLVGSDSEDFGQFEFLAGRADLTPPEREKIVKLTEALQQRPELVVEIAGVYHEAADVPVLQYLRLKDAVMERLGREPGEPGQDNASEMLTAEYRGVLEALHRERFPDIDLETIRAGYRAPPANDPEGEPQLDDLAYAADLRDRLLASEEIGPDALRALADARATAVRDAFLAGKLLTEDRLRLLEAVAVDDSEDDEWVVMELGVAIP